MNENSLELQNFENIYFYKVKVINLAIHYLFWDVFLEEYEWGWVLITIVLLLSTNNTNMSVNCWLWGDDVW